MKKLQHLFLFLVVVFSLSSCLFDGEERKKKDPWDNGKPTYYLDDTIKKFTVFPVGSWWVYQDSASGGYDTISVQSSNIEIRVSNKTDFNFESCRMILESSSFTYPISIGCANTGDTSELGTELNIYRETVVDSPSPIGGGIIFFSWDVDSLHVYGNSINTYGIMKRKWINQINGFKSVYVVTYPFEKSAYIPKINYFASGVGQIRKEMFNGEVWNLVNYHIAN